MNKKQEVKNLQYGAIIVLLLIGVIGSFGWTSPDPNIDIVNSSGAAALRFYGNDVGYGTGDIRFVDNGSSIARVLASGRFGYVGFIGIGNTDFRVYTSNSSGKSTERLRIEGGVDQSVVSFLNSQVGIGTTTPAAPLEVQGDVPGVRLVPSNDPNAWGELIADGSGIGFLTQTGWPVWVWNGAPSGALVVESDGTIGINQWGPLAGLHVSSEFNDIELLLEDDDPYPNSSIVRSMMRFKIPTGSADLSLYKGADTDISRFSIQLREPAGGSAATITMRYDSSSDIGELDMIANYINLFPVPLNSQTLTSANVHGDLNVFGDLDVSGSKNFVQEDPDNPDQVIVYAALEGPEVGTYIRGTATLVNGEAVIYLPDHFSKVTETEGLTVQLTPVGTWLELYVVEKSPEKIVVREAQGRDGQFDYFVQGIRKGYANFQVIRPKDTTATLKPQMSSELLPAGPPVLEKRANSKEK